MNKEEKEAIVNEYTKYWTLVDRVRDAVMDALDELSISDVISVLDRVKTELIQQETMVVMEEGMQSGAEETSDEIVNPSMIEPKLPDTKVGALLNVENLGELNKELKERINS